MPQLSPLLDFTTKQYAFSFFKFFPPQETVAPLPSTEGSKFVYVAPQVENNGPTAPDMEVLASRG